ncbi:IS66 family insertion sequence element accessory protein TnpB [Myxococcota bacterium]
MMLANVAVCLAVEAADRRGTFDRPAGLTRGVLQLDSNSGALFLFVNKRRNRVKALWWDKNGYAILYKRLARGTFVLPDLRRGQSAYVETPQRTSPSCWQDFLCLAQPLSPLP